MSLDLDATDIVSRGIQHPNPLFDFLTTFVPRKLKSMFTFCEYLYFNSPQIFAALNKFALYPVTEFIYKTDNPTLKERYKKLTETILKLKPVLVKTGIDRQLYGNSFTSIYFPFRRYLRCPKCNNSQNIKYIEYKFKLKGLQFLYKCSKCGQRVAGKVEDKKIRYAKGINIIRWDPKTIDVMANPITGEAEYYYTIPEALQQRVRRGDRHLLDTMPYAFLETIAQRQVFKFAHDQIFHMKADAPAGIDTHWGFPPITSTIKYFFYTAVLRKANEAIGLEHIVPFRVLHPQQSTTTADPTVTISLSNWVNETKINLKAWRRDPLHLMFAPIPLGVTHLGGQGRTLMVTQEIKEVEDSIIAGLGIPREFLYGGLTATGSPVTLRMLENQLLNYTTELVDQAQWILNKCGRYLGWEEIEVDLEGFKLIDDVQQKMAVLSANAEQGGTLLAPQSIAKLFGRDLKRERELRLQDTIDDIKFEDKIQRKIEETQRNLSTQARAATTATTGGGYNPSEVVAQADMIVQQLLYMPPDQVRAMMESLEGEDPVMSALVSKRLEDARRLQREEAESMAAQQGIPPSGMPGGAM